MYDSTNSADYFLYHGIHWLPSEFIMLKHKVSIMKNLLHTFERHYEERIQQLEQEMEMERNER